MAKLRVKEIVKQKGWTLAKVAEMLDVHPVNLSTTLNGNPTIATLEKIANVLEVDFVELFEREDRPTISGFLKVGNDVIEVSSVSDLEEVLSMAHKLNNA